MKELYVKPQLQMEQFTLTQSVATACGRHSWIDTVAGHPTVQSKHSCGWFDGGDVIWLSKAHCSDEYPENFEVEGACYNNPSGGVTLFGSV